MQSKLFLEFATPILITEGDDLGCTPAELARAVEPFFAVDDPWAHRSQELSNLLQELGGQATRTAEVTRLRERGVKRETSGDLHERCGEVRRLALGCIHAVRLVTERLLEGPLPGHIAPRVESCWASSYGPGDYHPVHNHPNTAWAAVYCVEDPAGDTLGGALDFLDPRAAIDSYASLVPLFGASTRSIRLRPGMLVIFPGWLRHFVHPFQGKGQRITISMNIDYGELGS
jgi:uncharacterized protein (TIGR02466 family)